MLYEQLHNTLKFKDCVPFWLICV